MGININKRNLNGQINPKKWNNWITKKNIRESMKFYGNCDYSKYLSKLL